MLPLMIEKAREHSSYHFKIGEYVTGKDRSFQRSLYLIESVDCKNYFLRLVALSGRIYDTGIGDGSLPDPLPLPISLIENEYRHAEPFEVERYLLTGDCE